MIDMAMRTSITYGAKMQNKNLVKQWLGIVFFALIVAFPYRIRHEFLLFGSVSIFDLAIVMMAFALLLHSLLNQGKFFIGNRLVARLLLVPGVVGIISLAWTQDLAETVYYIVVVWESIVAYFVAVNMLRSYNMLTVMHFVELVALFTIVTSFLSWFRVPGLAPFVPFEPGSAEYRVFLASYYTRLSSPFLGLSNNLATVLAFLFFLTWGFYSALRRRRHFIILAIILAAIVMTASMGVILALAVVTPLFIYWTRERFIRVLGILIASCCIIVVGVLGAFTVSEEFRTHYRYALNPLHKLYVSGTARLELFGDALRAIAEAPFLGYGGGVFLGEQPENKVWQPAVHNAYLQNMIFFGIFLGMLVNLTLVGLFFAFKRYVHTVDDTIVRKIGSGVTAAVLVQLLIFSVHASYEGTLLKPMFYLFVGVSVVLLRAARRKGRTECCTIEHQLLIS